MISTNSNMNWILNKILTQFFYQFFYKFVCKNNIYKKISFCFTSFCFTSFCFTSIVYEKNQRQIVLIQVLMTKFLMKWFDGILFSKYSSKLLFIKIFISITSEIKSVSNKVMELCQRIVLMCELLLCLK